MTARKYGVILADPPWSFKAYSDKGKGRSADNHYECLSFESLCAVPVAERAARDCALFLWTTDPMLLHALKLIEAWGFTYKTVGFYWVKLNKSAKIHRFAHGQPSLIHEADFFTGLGYWTRANPEMCLLATRGHPKRKAKNVSRLVVAPRREHSRKPDEIYQHIERLVAGPYIELFARQHWPRWDVWGDETSLFG